MNQLKIEAEDRLLNCIERRKLAFLGHVVRRDGLGKDLITGLVFWKRKRGRPKPKYKDNRKELTNLSMVQLSGMAQDGRGWKHFVMDATANHSNDLCVYTHFFISNCFISKAVLGKAKKLSNFSTGLKTAKQVEKLYFQCLTGNVN